MHFKQIANVLFCFSLPAMAATPIPTHMHGAWIYDSLYQGSTQLPPQAGIFTPEINAYNTGTVAAHQINELFSYGGDMEMYCSPTQGCSSKDLDIYYYPEPNLTTKTPAQTGDSGFRSTEAYKQGVTSPEKVIMSPIIDGRIDTGYLKPFNAMSTAIAKAYADKVSMAVCADDRVDGIQFDIEPFDISKPGQAAFYREIARDFSGHYGQGKAHQDSLHCVDEAHPNGRFFSVFTFSDQVNQTMADIFNQYHNGYVVDSLYDLSAEPGGTINPPVQYEKAVLAEVTHLKKQADQYGIRYQVAIPASASAHEFESVNGHATGYHQLTYVTEALNAVSAAGLRNDPNYIGADMWTWDKKMIWHGMDLAPSEPSAAVLQYLKQNL